MKADDIDAILPQTQCGECGYNGCRPYAEAIANGEASINLCPPGGKTGLLKLSEVTGIDARPYINDTHDLPLKKAIIREADCIGCMKCIKACPVDCIIGAAQLMHTIIEKECTGCELCIPACPVDCIELVLTEEEFNKDKAKERFEQYEQRKQKSRHFEEELYADVTFKHAEDPKAARLKAIQEAMARQSKK